MKFYRFSLVVGITLFFFACKDVKQANSESKDTVLSTKEESNASTMATDKQADVVQNQAKGLRDERKGSENTKSEEVQNQVDQFVNQKATVTSGEVALVKAKKEKISVEGSKVLPKAKGNKRKAKKTPKREKAIITFENPVLDFGEIKAGDIITHEFVFTNTGKSALSIKDATPSCGCTYPSLPFLPIQPGEQGKVGIEYNSVGKSGPQNATVTINSNASVPSFELTLKGNVIGDGKKEVLYDPREIVKKNKAIRDSIKEANVDSLGGE